MALTTQLGVIKSFMKSLDETNLSGTSAVDVAVATCSNSQFSSAQDVIDQMIKDCKGASSAEDFLTNYCGIILGNSDTGAITGSDVGGSTTKTATSIVPESGSWKSFTGNSFTRNGVTFKLVYYNDDYSSYSRNYSSLSDVQKIMWRGLYTWWGKESVKLISNSYSSRFGFTSSSSATTKTINFGFVEDDPGTLAWTATASSDGYKTASGLSFAINMDYYSNLSSTNKNGYDSTSGQTYLDRTLAHEFTHAVMSANINYFTYLPTIIKEGMAEFTHGIDDERSGDIQTLAENYSLLQQALNLGTGYHSVSGVNAPDYAGGYMFLHYLAKQSVDPNHVDGGEYIYTSKNNTVITGTAYNDTIYSGGDKVKINAKGGDDIVRLYLGSQNKVTVNAGDGNDSITAYGGSNLKIYGGADSDLVSLSNDSATVSSATIKGGSGTDDFYLEGKKLKVYGDSEKDYVRSYSGVSTSTLKGGAGDDSLIGGGKNTKMYGDSGADTFLIYSDDSYITVSGGAGADEIYDGGIRTSVNGGSGADYIHIYSNAIKTTVKAGTGNDTIKSYSEDGVTYVYKSGDGKDVIDGFNFGTDKIKITSGSIKKVSYSDDDVIFKIGSGSITIKEGKGKKITINGTTKTYGKSSSSTSSTGYSAPSNTAYVDTKAALASVVGSNGNDSITSSSIENNDAVENSWFIKDSAISYDTSNLASIMDTASAPVIDTRFKNANPYELDGKTPVLTYVKAANV